MKNFAELESSFNKAHPDNRGFPKRKNNFLEITKKKALVNSLSKTQVLGKTKAELGQRSVDNLEEVRRTIAKNSKKFPTKGSSRHSPSRPSTTKPIRENWNTGNHTSALELRVMDAERLNTMNTTWSNFSAEKTPRQTRPATSISSVDIPEKETYITTGQFITKFVINRLKSTKQKISEAMELENHESPKKSGRER